MSKKPQDEKAIKSLADSFQAIAGLLQKWSAAKTPPPTHDFPSYNLDKVAAAFRAIRAELEKAGPIGERVYGSFAAISDHLEAAAKALENE